MILFFMGVFLVSTLLTGVVRYYALNNQLMDIPNARSSHAIPTPRGGGVAIVICFIVGLLLFQYFNCIPLNMAIALIVGGGGMALLGFVDDKKNLRVTWRLFVQCMASIVALVIMQGMPALTVFTWTIPAGFVLNGLMVLYLVWLINLYNFMDGIDGIASIEAMMVCGGAVLLYGLHGDVHAMILPGLLAVATAGFLCWNFPYARIFLGDTGSVFLGCVLGLLSIQAARMDSHFFWSWLILLGVFIVDATVTVLRRAFFKQKITEAHCTHAYQNMAKWYKSHLPVIAGVVLINVGWLLPIALLVGLGLLDGVLGLVLAYLPLTVLAFKCRAGVVS